MTGRIAFVVAAVVLTTAEEARACDFGPPGSAPIDQNLDDGAAPGRIEDVGVSIERGKRRGDSAACDDLGAIRFHVEPPSDDFTASEDLGYLFELVDGEPPEGTTLAFSSDADFNVMADGSHDLWFHWVDGISREQEPIDFTVRMRAVDAAGNVGEPSDPIDVVDDGRACSVASHRSASSLVVLALVPICVRRRKRGKMH